MDIPFIHMTYTETTTKKEEKHKNVEFTEREKGLLLEAVHLLSDSYDQYAYPEYPTVPEGIQNSAVKVVGELAVIHEKLDGE